MKTKFLNYKQKYINVDDTHTVAYKEYGRVGGVPVLMFHGGPGGSINTNLIKLIDLDYFHLFTIDQRGCGLSTPKGCLKNNETSLLVEDIEKIRQTENLEKCIIFGRSWGTTLGILYALKYPQHCLSLVLRGIFLARDEDENWTFCGSQKIFPLQWAEFSHGLNPSCNLNQQFASLIFGASREIALEASRRMTQYFNILATNNPLSPKPSANDDDLIANRIFLHYSMNHYFLDDFHLTERLSDLEKNNIKGYIIHGGKDYDCRVEQAYLLHKLWPSSKLIIEPEASHCDYQDFILKDIFSVFEEIKGS